MSAAGNRRAAKQAEKHWAALERSVTIYRRQRIPLVFKLLVVLGVLNALTCAWVVAH